MGTILVVNAGSTSLKLRLVHADESVETVDALDGVNSSQVDAVGHRVVHGGQTLREPVVVDDSILAEIVALESLAPLHNAPAIAGIEAARRAVPDVPHVAVFDTAFHATMPPEAATYALPQTWRERWGIRRYGFHGLSVAWCTERAPAVLGVPSAGLRLVVCHLGGGCSVTAVKDGRSVDTTMGFSPLEGPPMTTRSGSVDPAALVYVQREHGLALDELERVLNEESGLKGLSGLSGDVRELEAAAGSDEGARLALAVYVHRVAGAVGTMAASLDGLDALVFTAGVGENSAGVRASVCERLGFLGVDLDDAHNERGGSDEDVATAASAVRVLVIAAREELVVARATRELLALAS